MQLLLNASSPIPSHALIALLAVLVGGVQLYRKKGDVLHKVFGYVWVVLLCYVAVSSFFISEIKTFGVFSYIHILSALTLVLLCKAVIDVRKGKIKAHARAMKYLYILALLITGAFTLLPGRLMSEVMYSLIFSAGIF